jgi:L-ribulose-5-phosphate 3-epimerase
MMNDRREFLKKAGLAGAALPFINSSSIGETINPKNTAHQICYFTKHLQWLDFDDLGIALKEAGFDGADLTVRPGGHVEPEQAGSVLSGVVQTLQKHGISMPMVVTKISDPKAKGLDDLLKALSDNGVQHYRMGYLNYDYSMSIEKNIENFHQILKRLEEKNANHNICGGYQNHAGTRLGASIWDLWLSLKGLDPSYISCQFDVRHAVFEGGRSWENDFRCIKDFIRTTVVKDFYWEKNDKGIWSNHNTQMGEGMVDFDRYFKIFHELKIDGPISNHSEYALITKEESKLPKKEKMKIAIKRLKHDVDYTKKYLN